MADEVESSVAEAGDESHRTMARGEVAQSVPLRLYTRTEERTSERKGHKTLDHIRRAMVSPHVLAGNATEHKWVFSAIAELADNALDAEARDFRVSVCSSADNAAEDNAGGNAAEDGNGDDSAESRGRTLIISDNGKGLSRERLVEGLSFGFCHKSPDKVGRFGSGMKTGIPRLADVALIFTSALDEGSETDGHYSIALFSKHLHEKEELSEIHYPMVSYRWSTGDAHLDSIAPGTPGFDDSEENGELVHKSNLKYLLENSGYVSEDALMARLLKIFRFGSHHTGMQIEMSHLTPDLDFDSDPHDIRQSSGRHTTEGLLTQKMSDMDASLRRYLSFLWADSRTEIVVRDQAVEQYRLGTEQGRRLLLYYGPSTRDGLHQERFLPYVPRDVSSSEVQVYFGVSMQEDAETGDKLTGCFFYNKGRLIRGLQPLGKQRARVAAPGVLGVILETNLETTKTKQDYMGGKAYDRLAAAVTIRMDYSIRDMLVDKVLHVDESGDLACIAHQDIEDLMKEAEPLLNWQTNNHRGWKQAQCEACGKWRYLPPDYIMAPEDKFECSMPQGMWTGEFAANEHYTNCAAPIEEPEQEDPWRAAWLQNDGGWLKIRNKVNKPSYMQRKQDGSYQDRRLTVKVQVQQDSFQKPVPYTVVRGALVAAIEELEDGFDDGNNLSSAKWKALAANLPEAGRFSDAVLSHVGPWGALADLAQDWQGDNPGNSRCGAPRRTHKSLAEKVNKFLLMSEWVKSETPSKAAQRTSGRERNRGGRVGAVPEPSIGRTQAGHSDAAAGRSGDSAVNRGGRRREKAPVAGPAASETTDESGAGGGGSSKRTKRKPAMEQQALALLKKQKKAGEQKEQQLRQIIEENKALRQKSSRLDRQLERGNAQMLAAYGTPRSRPSAAAAAPGNANNVPTNSHQDQRRDELQEAPPVAEPEAEGEAGASQRRNVAQAPSSAAGGGGSSHARAGGGAPRRFHEGDKVMYKQPRGPEVAAIVLANDKCASRRSSSRWKIRCFTPTGESAPRGVDSIVEGSLLRPVVVASSPVSRQPPQQQTPSAADGAGAAQAASMPPPPIPPFTPQKPPPPRADIATPGASALRPPLAPQGARHGIRLRPRRATAPADQGAETGATTRETHCKCGLDAAAMLNDAVVICDECGRQFHPECLGMEYADLEHLGQVPFRCADHEGDDPTGHELDEATKARKQKAAMQQQESSSFSRESSLVIAPAAGSRPAEQLPGSSTQQMPKAPPGWPTDCKYTSRYIYGSHTSESEQLRSKMYTPKFLEGVRIASTPSGHPAAGQLGLYATRTFEVGQLIGLYTGQVTEATSYNESWRRSEYVMEICHPSNHRVIVLVDARKYGNETRLINSYKNVPGVTKNNVYSTTTFSGTGEIQVEIRVLQVIREGDEILLDYTETYDGLLG